MARLERANVSIHEFGSSSIGRCYRKIGAFVGALPDFPEYTGHESKSGRGGKPAQRSKSERKCRRGRFSQLARVVTGRERRFHRAIPRCPNVTAFAEHFAAAWRARHYGEHLKKS